MPRSARRKPALAGAAAAGHRKRGFATLCDTPHRGGTGFVKDAFLFENVGAVIDRPKDPHNGRRKRAINDRPYIVLSYTAQHHRQTPVVSKCALSESIGELYTNILCAARFTKSSINWILVSTKWAFPWACPARGIVFGFLFHFNIHFICFCRFRTIGHF